MRIFYSTLQQNPTLITPLNRLKINTEHITTQLGSLANVEKAYTEYNKEKGESQQAAAESKTEEKKGVYKSDK